MGWLAHMHGETWGAVPAEFETGHLPGAIWKAVVAKFETEGFVVYLWDVGSA